MNKHIKKVKAQEVSEKPIKEPGTGGGCAPTK